MPLLLFDDEIRLHLRFAVRDNSTESFRFRGVLSVDMAPQNIAEMLDNSNLDATWEKFVKYLIRFKFLAVGKVENLSLPQLKTIYNLNFKHNEVSILTLLY